MVIMTPSRLTGTPSPAQRSSAAPPCASYRARGTLVLALSRKVQGKLYTVKACELSVGEGVDAQPLDVMLVLMPRAARSSRMSRYSSAARSRRRRGSSSRPSRHLHTVRTSEP